MTDYSKFNKEEILKIVEEVLSTEEFMKKTGLHSLDKKKPLSRFNIFFGIDLKQKIRDNRNRDNLKKIQEYNDRIVECEYCHKQFRYGDHPSHNKADHNFCCDEHRFKYIAAGKQNKLKQSRCIKCGKDIFIHICQSDSTAMCDDCRKEHLKEKQHILYFHRKDKSKEDSSKHQNRRHTNRFCKHCGKELKRHQSIYCSLECSAEDHYEEYIKRWKAGLETGMKGDMGIAHPLSRYIHEKYENKCARCGWHEVNQKTGKSPLEIEHIDGNHKNNKEENLILLCPNCHSLTPTYRALNWGHGRNRKKYYR